jgi:hypothetical protein
MAQPNKGQRHLIQSRVPLYLRDQVAEYAANHGLAVSEALADLAAKALGAPLPSEVLPIPKTRRQREELPLAMPA